jgi:hypothetical protein
MEKNCDSQAYNMGKFCNNEGTFQCNSINVGIISPELDVAVNWIDQEYFRT